MRPSSLSPFALYAGPLISTSIAAAVAGQSEADRDEFGGDVNHDFAPAAPESQCGGAAGGQGDNNDISPRAPHPSAPASPLRGEQPRQQHRGPSADPQQLSAYAMALYQELQAAEPPSPDTSIRGAPRPSAAPATPGSAAPLSTHLPPSWSPGGDDGGGAAAATALQGAPSHQSSQLLFHSREYGLYGLYEQSSSGAEQLITGYRTSLPLISPRE
jgi:hypothetical protein